MNASVTTQAPEPTDQVRQTYNGDNVPFRQTSNTNYQQQLPQASFDNYAIKTEIFTYATEARGTILGPRGANIKKSLENVRIHLAQNQNEQSYIVGEITHVARAFADLKRSAYSFLVNNRPQARPSPTSPPGTANRRFPWCRPAEPPVYSPQAPAGYRQPGPSNGFNPSCATRSGNSMDWNFLN